MDLQSVSCSNTVCLDKHKVGAGNIRIHSRKDQRCYCKTCGQRLNYRYGTIFYGLKYDEQTVVWAVELVSHGCPAQAVVKTFGVDERTLSDWLERAGHHLEAFHHQQMQPLNLEQVQVDEIKLKKQKGSVWVAMALAVPSRLWLGAVCQVARNKDMAEQILTCVYLWAAQLLLVISFDGWSCYPKAAGKVFREAFYTGRGRARQIPWQCLTLVQLVKGRAARPLRWLLSGSATALRYLLNLTQGLDTTINTAYIERLNATFRAHLAPFARRTRCPYRSLATVKPHVYLIGCCYNFCWPHSSLTLHSCHPVTPAMAAGLTDHVWSLRELFWYRLKPFKASTI